MKPVASETGMKPVALKPRFDALIGRVTMYRLVSLCLTLLAVLAFVFSLAGHIAYTPTALLASLATLLVVTQVSSRVFALLFRVTPHTESSIITALLLFFILQPTTDVTTLGQVAVAAVFASASKYLLAVRGRHVFNPAAVGAVWLAVFHFYLAYWWIGSPAMLPFTSILVLLVLYRTRRLPLGAVFVVIAGAILLGRSLSGGGTIGTALTFAFGQTPLIFVAGFMLSEPLTLPPTRWQQLSVAAVVAVLFSVPITVGSYLIGPETALILGNAVAFLFGQRQAVELQLTAKRRLSPTSMEYSFTPRRGLLFKAGQYLELSLPHKGPDVRGTRRAFSITSGPDEVGAVRIGIKVPEPASTFKKSLGELPLGVLVGATGVSGDFVLPKNESKPLLLIAGGIGITPFISHLTSLPDGHRRDIVLVYSAGDASEVSYLDEIRAAQVRTVVITRNGTPDLPLGFESVTSGRLDRDLLAAVVPDIARRHVYISGPPSLVGDMSGVARSLKARSIHKDYFNGY